MATEQLVKEDIETLHTLIDSISKSVAAVSKYVDDATDDIAENQRIYDNAASAIERLNAAQNYFDNVDPQYAMNGGNTRMTCSYAADVIYALESLAVAANGQSDGTRELSAAAAAFVSSDDYKTIRHEVNRIFRRIYNSRQTRGK